MRISRSSIGFGLVLGALVQPAGLSADSDGYYCSGPGYLAFQLRSWSTAGPHLLKVIRFGDGEIREAGQVELPDFQPHAIRCEAERVRIVGWALHYVEYSIDVSGEPRIVEAIEDHDLAFSPDLFTEEMTNLGDWAVPGSTTLSTEDSHHEYRLVITRHSSPVPGGLEHHTRSVLVAQDESGSVVSELLVYEGTFFESVH
jgi:hypothetical protein